MSPEPFVHSERVRFGDLDAMRHLNNVEFLRYFENARIAFLRSLVPGYDPEGQGGGGFATIFAECHITYRSPVSFDEQVDIEISVGEVKRSAFRLEFRMSVGERLAAEGHGWLVSYDHSEQRSSPLPDEVRERLEAAAGAPS